METEATAKSSHAYELLSTMHIVNAWDLQQQQMHPQHQPQLMLMCAECGTQEGSVCID